MKNIKIKTFLYLLVIVSAIAWLILSWYSGIDLKNIIDLAKTIPKVVTIDAIIVGIFTKYLWKYKIFRGWLVPFPNLNGTWIGEIHSDWINPKNNKKILPIPVMLTIDQTFFHINFMMATEEMKSHSYVEGFKIDKENQIKQVAYLYTSKPRIVLDSRSLPSDGAIIFDIIEKPKMKLIGQYWTDRKTKGEVILLFNNTKKLEELPKSMGKHPVTEDKFRR
jgi:hypothetical protein